MKTEARNSDGGIHLAAIRQGRRALLLASWIPSIALADAPVMDPMQAPPAATLARPARSPTVATASAATVLDRRIALLTAELALSESQQSQVRALLQRQREEVLRLWNDQTVPPALRVGRTQAVSQRTADAIRGVLDEEQRKRYIQPRQRNAAMGAGGSDVEAWMTTATGR